MTAWWPGTLTRADGTIEDVLVCPGPLGVRSLDDQPVVLLAGDSVQFTHEETE